MGVVRDDEFRLEGEVFGHDDEVGLCLWVLAWWQSMSRKNRSGVKTPYRNLDGKLSVFHCKGVGLV